MNRVGRRGFAIAAALAVAGCAGSKPPLPPPSAGPPEVRVAVRFGVDTEEVTARGAYTVADDTGVFHAARAGQRLRAVRVGEEIVLRGPVGEEIARGPGPFWIRPDDRSREVVVGEDTYSGRLVIHRGTRGGLHVVDVLDLETYLRNVVPAEIGHKGKYLQAAMAQAVAARTYAVGNMDRYPEEGFDLHAGINDQVYASNARRHPDSDRAVALTRGQVLVYDGATILARYASTCGGVTADARESFDLPAVPYLRSQDDRVEGKDACRTSRYYRWEAEWSGDELYRILSRTVPAVTGRPWRGTTLRDLDVRRRGESGRAVVLRVTTDLTYYDLERMGIRLGLERPEGGALRSNAFELDVKRSDDRVVRVVARGRGWGHGVGMCQWGAMQLSSEGKSAAFLLKHYYPETRIQRLY